MTEAFKRGFIDTMCKLAQDTDDYVPPAEAIPKEYLMLNPNKVHELVNDELKTHEHKNPTDAGIGTKGENFIGRNVKSRWYWPEDKVTYSPYDPNSYYGKLLGQANTDEVRDALWRTAPFANNIDPADGGNFIGFRRGAADFKAYGKPVTHESNAQDLYDIDWSRPRKDILDLDDYDYDYPSPPTRNTQADFDAEAAKLSQEPVSQEYLDAARAAMANIFTGNMFPTDEKGEWYDDDSLKEYSPNDPRRYMGDLDFSTFKDIPKLVTQALEEAGEENQEQFKKNKTIPHRSVESFDWKGHGLDSLNDERKKKLIEYMNSMARNAGTNTGTVV